MASGREAYGCRELACRVGGRLGEVDLYQRLVWLHLRSGLRSAAAGPRGRGTLGPPQGLRGPIRGDRRAGDDGGGAALAAASVAGRGGVGAGRAGPNAFSAVVP
jgi:hypothetical protein